MKAGESLFDQRLPPGYRDSGRVGIAGSAPRGLAAGPEAAGWIAVPSGAGNCGSVAGAADVLVVAVGVLRGGVFAVPMGTK
jgi:hypothetical protein